MRQELAQALCKQKQLEHELCKLNLKHEKMIERLQSKDKVIAEQNEELFKLRTQVAAVTDSLKQRAHAYKKNNDNKWRYIEKEQADEPLSGASGQKNNDNEAKDHSDGWSGGPSGKKRRQVTGGTN